MFIKRFSDSGGKFKHRLSVVGGNEPIFGGEMKEGSLVFAIGVREMAGDGEIRLDSSGASGGGGGGGGAAAAAAAAGGADAGEE